MALLRWVFFGFCVSLLFGSTQKPNYHATLRNFDRPHTANDLLIKFKAHLAPMAQADFVAKFGGTITHHFRISKAAVVHFAALKKHSSLAVLAEKIAASENVEYIEANTILHTSLEPNDARFGELYGLHNVAQTGGTADSDIDAPEAWDISTGSRSVVVGVIDTGINYLHPDLAPNAWTNPKEAGLDEQGNDKKTNGLDDDGNGYVDDWRGWDFVNNDNDPMDDNSHMHGSHTSGTIGASGNDGFGVVGVNWEVSLVGIKFLSASGSGTLDNAVKAIEYASSIDVNLTNNSWGGGGFSQPMYDAIKDMGAKSILFVASAGNEASDTDQGPAYPASYDLDSIVSVAATDNKDALATFSNFGFNTVDLAAPGVGILSTSNDAVFRSLNGTSMAAPHVAGAAALILAVHPGLPLTELKNRLLFGTDRVDALVGLTRTGGRLNVARSLETDTVAPAMVTGFVVKNAERNSVDFEWSTSGDDGADGEASGYEVRYADQAIVTEQDWGLAKIGKYSSLRGTSTGTVQGFRFNYAGFASVRAFDNVGNLSPLGESIPFSVKTIQIIFENTASSMDGVTADGKWALQTVNIREENTAFTDSPNEWYLDNSDSSLTLAPISVANANVTFVYSCRTDIEKGYDFGYVELSLDSGATWEQVDLVTGTKGWHMRQIDLSTKLGDKRQFQVRFHLKTDYVIQADGWFIDDVMVITD